jgi:hypothetical protein
MSALDTARTHSKLGYKVLTPSIAAALTPEEWASIPYPAQRGAANRLRCAAGLPAFTRADLVANVVVVGAKAAPAPVVKQLEQSVEMEREIADEPAPKKSKKARKGIGSF